MSNGIKFYTSDEKMPIFASEELEPFAVTCIDRWFSRCEVARKIKEKIEETCKKENRKMMFGESFDTKVFFRECQKFWWGINALSSVSIVTDDAVHFNLCISNEKRHIAEYIEKHLGFNPLTDKEKSEEVGFVLNV